MAHRHHVVIVGAGFGGLAAARHLRAVPVDVTLVDANNFHTFQPLLYQVATAGLDGDDIAYAARGIFHRQRNATFHLGRVERVDLEARTVHLATGAPLVYDTLVLALGAVSNTYGIPGVDEHALGLKSLTEAVELRAHVLRQFERADADPSVVAEGGLTFVIAGGGPTGVELAGGLSELFKVLRRDFPRLDVTRARIVLVEPTDRLLGTFHPRLSEHAARTLRSRGVEVELGVGVAKASSTAVVLTDGRAIPTATLVWTAGVRAHPLADTLGVEQTRGGRIVVAPDLSLPDHPEVFVVGDLAASPAPGGDGLLPQVAPVAIQGGTHVARQIRARLEGRPTSPFRYRDKGSMATIGRNAAVAELPPGIRLTGFVGWLAWLGLHLVQLIGFRNRANVLVNWAWNYLTYDRGARIIVGDP